MLYSFYMKSIDIGLIIAMKEEADVLASSLDLKLNKLFKQEFLLYSNQDESIVVLCPGVNRNFTSEGRTVCRVGKVSAGIIASILIQKYRPKMIVNCGTAGGIKSAGVEIGDIIIADNVVNHDCHFINSPYKEYGSRKIAIKNYKLQLLKQSYKIGTVSSGESFITTTFEWNALRKSKAVAKEMEAAGILQAAEILNYKKPIFIIKSITDLIDEKIQTRTSHSQYMKNYLTAIKSLKSIIKEIIDNRTKFLSL